jgi:hypothetical protein
MNYLQPICLFPHYYHKYIEIIKNFKDQMQYFKKIFIEANGAFWDRIP